MMFFQENFLLIMIWVLSVFISVTAYTAVQNTFPTGMEVLLGHTLYAIPAMPNAFLNTIGFYNDNAAHRDLLFWLSCAFYWLLLGVVHYWYFEENREPKYLAVIAFFTLVSSFKWLYFAVALMRAS